MLGSCLRNWRGIRFKTTYANTVAGIAKTTRSALRIAATTSSSGKPKPPNLLANSGIIGSLPNVQDEPRPWLARAVLLGARTVTAMVVGSGALLGFWFIFVFRDRFTQRVEDGDG